MAAFPEIGPIPQGGTGETNRPRPHPKSGERRRVRQPLRLDRLPSPSPPQQAKIGPALRDRAPALGRDRAGFAPVAPCQRTTWTTGRGQTKTQSQMTTRGLPRSPASARKTPRMRRRRPQITYAGHLPRGGPGTPTCAK
jgi:hypothetical protein